MGATDRQSDSDESRRDRRERYQTLLRVLNLQTSDEQPPAARRHTIKHILCANGYSAKKVESSIRAAREQNDIWMFVDPDGDARLVRVTEDDLLDLVRWLADYEHPDQQLIGRANRRLQEVQSDA